MDLINANSTQISAFSSNLASEIYDSAYLNFEPLPEVCEEGQACRDSLATTTRNNVGLEWETAIYNI